MEDQDREARMDEEVEAHHHKAAPAKHKARGDDGDDVEGHVFIAKHKAKHKA